MLSAFKNFFITLLIAAAMFGVIAYFATQFVTATVSDILDDEEAALESIMTQDKPETDSTGETLPAGSDAVQEKRCHRDLIRWIWLFSSPLTTA